MIKVHSSELIKGNTYIIGPKTMSRGVYLGQDESGALIFEGDRRALLHYGNPSVHGKIIKLATLPSGLNFWEEETNTTGNI